MVVPTGEAPSPSGSSAGSRRGASTPAPYVRDHHPALVQPEAAPESVLERIRQPVELGVLREGIPDPQNAPP